MDASADSQDAQSIKLDKLKIDLELRIGLQGGPTSLQDVDLGEKLTSSILDGCVKCSHLHDILELKPYPDTKTLAELASLVYSNEIGYGEIADGWRLIATAWNQQPTNGYFGAAFAYPNQNCIVIAHRGTDITNIGALIADFQGIVREKYVSQMNSAMTFSMLISRLIKKHNDEITQPKTPIQLSFTGHSLGGWLAQVTTFAVKYLHEDEQHHLVVNNSLSDGYHAHTVVFDSPGCEPMLSKMKKDLYERYDMDNFIYINRLDITSYLSAPNLINTCNLHVGTIFRVFPEISDMTFLDKYTAKYNLAVHSMDKILSALKDERRPIVKVLDWPLIKGLTDRSEYKEFFKWGSKFNSYHPDKFVGKFKGIRYKTQSVDSRKCSYSVLSEQELNVLKKWKRLTRNNLNLLQNFVKNHKITEYEDIVKECRIKNKTLKSESLERVVLLIKSLMRWCPEEISNVIEEGMLFRSQSDEFIKNLSTSIISDIYFKDKLKIQTFVTSDKAGILLIETSDTRLEVIRTFRLLDKHTLFFSWTQLIHFNAILDVNLVRETPRHVLVIECPGNMDDEKLLFRLLESFRKVVLITANGCQIQNDDKIVRHRATKIEFDDVLAESRKKILQQKAVSHNGQELSLQELFDPLPGSSLLNKMISSEWLKRLIFRNSPLVILNNENFGVSEVQVLYDKVGLEMTTDDVVKILLSDGDVFGKSVMFMVTGLCNDEELMRRFDVTDETIKCKLRQAIADKRIVVSGDGDFKKFCHDNPDSRIYLFRVTDDTVECSEIYDCDFYLNRRFVSRDPVVIDFKIAEKFEEKEDAFVFTNVWNQEQLKSIFNVKKGSRLADFLDHTDYVTASPRAGASFPLKTDFDSEQIHFIEHRPERQQLIWLRSAGSLDNLRPYIVDNILNISNQKDLTEKNWKSVVIAAEPGMGKSTSLTSLAFEMKSRWVIRVNLKDCQEDIYRCVSTDTLAEFLLPKTAAVHDRSLLKSLLECSLKCASSRPVHLMFDGFDEIRETEGETVTGQEKILEVLRFITNHTYANIWITTRKHLTKKLENALSVLSVTFEGITKENQREYLNRIWASRLVLQLDDFNESKKNELSRYVASVLEKAEEVLGADMSRFMGVPLQLSMIATVARPTPDIFGQIQPDVEKFFRNVADLYCRYVDEKFDIYFKRTRLHESSTRGNKEAIKQIFLEKHKKLGFNLFFLNFLSKEAKDRFRVINVEECNEVGIVQVDHQEKIEFVHLTLAEYFAAKFMYDWFIQQKEDFQTYPYLENVLFFKILVEDSYKVIRMFLRDLFAQSKPDPEVMKFHSARIAKFMQENSNRQLNNEGQSANPIDVTKSTECVSGAKTVHRAQRLNQSKETALHVSVKEYNEIIVKILIDALKEKKKISATQESSENAGEEDYINFQDSNGNTSLHFAADSGQTDTCSLLLDNGADITAVNDKMQEPLHLAANSGYADASVLLLKRQAGINAKDKYGKTALHCTCEGGHSDVASALLSFGADFDIGDLERKTALHYAAKNGHREVFSLLLDKGANVNAVDKNEMTSLHLAAEKGSEEVCELLMMKGANVNSANTYQATALHCAAEKGHRDVCLLLLSNGADITAVGSDRKTALHYAAQHDHVDVCKLLLLKGADVNAVTRLRSTALHIAAEEGFAALCSHLLSKGANVNAVDEEGRTALHFAARYGRYDAVAMLFDKGADVNASDDSEQTALHYAARSGDTGTCCLIIENGGEVHAKDVYFKTPLHEAASCGHEDVCRLLISKRAIVDDRQGRGTPFTEAASNGYIQTCGLLLKNGANINAIASGRHGGTALHQAAYRGDIRTCSWLLDKGASANTINRKKDTPLHVAAGACKRHHRSYGSCVHERICSLLLSNGANIATLNYRGETAVDAARRKACEQIDSFFNIFILKNLSHMERRLFERRRLRY